MKGRKFGGRKKGTPNKSSRMREKEKEIAASGLTPLDFMLGIMRNEQLPEPYRLDAAKSAAPYVHPKLANIEHQGKDGGNIVIEIVRFAPETASE